MNGQSNDVQLSPIAQFWYEADEGCVGDEDEEKQYLRETWAVFDEFRAARARGDVDEAIRLTSGFRARYRALFGPVERYATAADFHLEYPNLILYRRNRPGGVDRS